MEDGPIELRDLRYFTLAAQMQHISRAAAAPGVSQPFLTKIIRQLENELGAPLFDHTGRGVTLRPCGKLVYEKSQTILALVDALHNDVDDLLVRTEKNYIFLVDAPGYLPEMTLAYQKAFPGRTLTARYCMRGEILEALRTGKADFATLMPPLQPGECPELESRTMYFDPGCIFLPPDSPLLKKDVLTLDDLRDLPIVTSPKGGGIRGDLDLFFARHGLRPNIVSELADASTVVMMVSQGGRLRRDERRLYGPPCMGALLPPPQYGSRRRSGPVLEPALDAAAVRAAIHCLRADVFRRTAAISKNRITLPIAQSAQTRALCAIDISPVMDVYGTKDRFLHERTDKTISNLVRVD